MMLIVHNFRLLQRYPLYSTVVGNVKLWRTATAWDIPFISVQKLYQN